MDGCRVTRGARRRGRPRRVEGSNTLLPTYSATLFPRGSLRPKFIARGNAPPCFYTLLPDLSSYFYHHVYSLSLFAIILNLALPLFSPPFLSVLLLPDRRTIPENIKCLPGLLRTRGFASSISRLNCSSERPPPGTLLSPSLSPFPLLAARGTVPGDHLPPPRTALTRVENTKHLVGIT